jgi:hypothetical protein
MRSISAIILSFLFLTPPPALAWSNGPDGPDAFGTHDWILDRALDHSDANWVKRRVALRATDDPDTRDGIEYASAPWWHVYDEWGETYGGADEAADVWFRRIKSRLEYGNERGASRALGYFAHIVGDIAQPLHTDGSDREDSVHSSYESAVDGRIGTYRFDYNGFHHAAPVGRVVVLARKSHRFYSELVREYDRHGYNDRVDEITKRQLDRGANVLADLIDSL